MNRIKLMEVCGTHTVAIARAGIRELMPEGIELISGPGCPVCVTSQEDIDRAVAVAQIDGVIMATFGDMMRVPGSKMSLHQAKMQGADVRLVYSSLDALDIALANPGKNVVFMGIGFETTSPTVAVAVRQAKAQGVKNFFVLSNFKLIFPALSLLAQSPKVQVDGFICPGHVSVITGSIPYEDIARRYKRPCVITGFEEADIIGGIERLIKQIKEGTARVEIAYKRAVTRDGNVRAMQTLFSVFEACDSRWRGLGVIRKSGLLFKKEYAGFSAEKTFRVKVPAAVEPKGCICGEVLQGIKSPGDCLLFGKRCTPQSPVGPCMVSSEGTCAAWYKFKG